MRVLWIPSWMSARCSSERSIWVYDFAASMRFVIRLVVSVSSDSNCAALMVDDVHGSAAPSASDPTIDSHCSNHASSAPTEAKRGAMCHGSSTPRVSSQLTITSSRSIVATVAVVGNVSIHQRAT